MYECSPGELLTRAAFMHPDNEGYTSLKHYAALKLTGLNLTFAEVEVGSTAALRVCSVDLVPTKLVLLFSYFRYGEGREEAFKPRLDFKQIMFECEFIKSLLQNTTM